MNDNFENVLDSLPEKAPRSRLEPYSKLIVELRRRKRTYREILDVLAEKCNLRVSISTLHDFVRAKAKEAKRAAKVLRTTVPQAEDKNQGALSPEVSRPKLTADRPSDDEIRRRIAALRQRPRAIPADSSGGFQYNPDEPLRLVGPTQKPRRG